MEIKTKIFAMLDAGSKVLDIERELKIDRDKIGRIKSEWLVIVGRREAERREHYLNDNAERFRAAKRKRREEEAKAKEPIKAKNVKKKRTAKNG